MDAASWRKAAKPVLIHSYLSWSGYRVLDKPHIISFHFLRGPCWAWDTRPTIWFKIPIFRLRAKDIVGKLECCLDKTLWSEQSMREIFYLVSNSCFPGIFFLFQLKMWKFSSNPERGDISSSCQIWYGGTAWYPNLSTSAPLMLCFGLSCAL